MNDALKELFNAYKYLPVGVMFFKNETLFFVNEHLRTLLLLANLSSDEIIEIIGSMVGLENPSHSTLNDFLTYNDLFLYGDRVIQIERNIADDITIFVLIRLSEKAIEAVDSTRELRLLRREKNINTNSTDHNEAEILEKALGSWEKGHFPSIVLYKGIPIKSDCMIMDAKGGEISIKVEKKQLAAAQVGTQWLVGTKRNAMLYGEVCRYDLNRSTVSLENLTILSQGFHLRNVIRYIADEDNDRLILTIQGKKSLLALRNVSEKGISVKTDDTSILVALSTISGRTINAILLLNGNKIAINAVWLYTVPLDESSGMMKIAFTIGYDLHNGALLREWMNAGQLQLIKEVRNFIQMIPTPEKETPHNWVI
ncbi:hypothetical protein [Sulfuricurvum sp.]|uniref:hypothetical protein n=1 Tax=Sulfuricurvum sp. TaxID=2025608 RepID=UPI00286E00E8|nr:hypothetical protein [Sulfuricurvum sp.]